MPALETGAGPLAHLRVLVSGQGRAAVTTGALLADYGAEVVVLEPPEGHPLRGWLDEGTGRPLAWSSVARNLRSVVADPTSADGPSVVDSLIAGADVVVVDPDARFAQLQRSALDAHRTARPDLVIVALSPFGLTGPRTGDPGSDVAAEALAGLAHITGHPDREPLHSDYPVATAVTSLFGALSTVATLRSRDAGEGGALVDVASVDVVVRILDFVAAFHDQLGLVSERANSTSDYQVPVNRWLTSDERWMSFTGNTNDIVLRFFRAMDRPELGDDERFSTNAARVEHKALLEAEIEAWFAAHTRAEVDAAMVRERVPIAAIVAMDEIFAEEQFAVRSAITAVDDAAGPLRVPNVAMRFSSTPGSVRSLGPGLGADTDSVPSSWTPRGSAVAVTPHVPRRDRNARLLEGVRVLDIGNVIAGPLSATLLGDLGADVVKVERPGGGDLFRSQAPQKDGGSVWWRVVGRGKRSIALDLKDPDDRNVFYDLARRADVLIENMVPGVVASLGVDHERVAKVNPSIVSVSISGYGQFGPMARRPAFGRNAEAYSGMAYMTGYRGDLPQHTGFPVADAFSALFAAFGSVVALTARDRDEERAGQHVDVALFESVFRFMEPQVALYDATGEVWIRGRAATDPLQWRRCVPTADDRWLSLSVGPTADLASVAAWSGVAEQDLLERPEVLDASTRTRPLADLLASAIAAGVPAAAASTAVDLGTDDHLVARGVLTTQIDPEIGEMVAPAVAPVIDGKRPLPRRPAPALDAHRVEILADWNDSEPRP